MAQGGEGAKGEKRYWARYRGAGFVPGTPARDLTAEEVEALGVEVVRRGRIWELIEVGEETAEETAEAVTTSVGEEGQDG